MFPFCPCTPVGLGRDNATISYPQKAATAKIRMVSYQGDRNPKPQAINSLQVASRGHRACTPPLASSFC